jgi:hypothetical protein
MNLAEIKQKIMENTITVAIWVILSLIGIATVIRNVLSWYGWFNGLILWAVVIDQKSATITVKPWFFWFFAALVSSCLVFFAQPGRANAKRIR